MSGYPVLGAIPVTVAAMRAAAEVLEAAGIAGLSVTCSDNEITVQVSDRLGDTHTRAGIVARLADQLDTCVYQDHSPTMAVAWLRARGHVRGFPVCVFTPLAVRTTGDQAGHPLAVTTSGGGEGDHVDVVEWLPGRRLPAGWRWATELDTTPNQRPDQRPDQEVA